MSTSAISGPGDLTSLATISLSFGIDRILSKTLGDSCSSPRFTTVNDTHNGGERDARPRDEVIRVTMPVNKDGRQNSMLEPGDFPPSHYHDSGHGGGGGSEAISPATNTVDNVSGYENRSKILSVDKFLETAPSNDFQKTMYLCPYVKSEHLLNTPQYTLPNCTLIRCLGEQDIEGRLSSYEVDSLGPCLSSCVDNCCSRQVYDTIPKTAHLRAGPPAFPQRGTQIRNLRQLGVHFPNMCLLPWTRQSPSWVDVRRERVSLVLRGPLFEKSQTKRKKPRTSFTRLQIVELEKRFHRQKYLSSAERSSIAKTLKMTDGQVKTWFQNRRTKWRRQTAEERDAEREAASRLILSLQTDKSQCLDVTNSMCLKNSSLHALQNLRPWNDEGVAGESDT